MKLKKLFIPILVLCVCLMLSTIELQAGQKYLNISLERQQMSNWCWAACSQCYVRYKAGNYYSQRAYVIYIHGSACNCTGTTSQIVRACRAGGASASSTGSLSFSYVKSLTNSNRPFIVGRSGHAMVGFGYKDTGGQYVAIGDPWYGSSSWYNYNTLRSGWFMTVL